MGEVFNIEIRAEIKQLVYGLWMSECHGYVCRENALFHGIMLEILLTSMWPLAVLSVRRHDVSCHMCPIPMSMSCVLGRCGENSLSITCCHLDFHDIYVLCLGENEVGVTYYHLVFSLDTNMSACVAPSSVCNI